MALNQVRNRFVVASVLLLVVCAGALAFLFSPWGRPPEQRLNEYNRLRAEWHQKQRDSQSIVGMPERLKRAEKDSQTLLETRLPEQSSQVSNEIGKLAAANKVKLEHAAYETQDTDLPGVQRLVIKASLTADYLQLVKFINSLEREKKLMLIDSIKLNEQQAGNVNVDLVMEAYKKSGS